MIKLEFFENGHEVNFPECLSECDTREYIDMSKFIFLYSTNQINLPQFQRLAVYSLLNVELSKRPLKSETERLVSQNVAFLSQYVMNFFDEKENEENGLINIIPKLDFIHNPMKTVTINKVKFVGPDDNMQNVTFGDYVDAHNVYFDYLAFSEIQSLRKLFDIFYKPKNKIFYGLMNKTISNGIDMGILYGFFLFFASFQKWLSTSAKVHYEGVEIDLSIIFQSKDVSPTKSSNPGLGMKSLFHTVAETNVFGDADKLRETPLWDVLPFLYGMRKKSLDEKEEFEKIKKKRK